MPIRPAIGVADSTTGARLVVDGAPRLLLGGQVHNSTPSSPGHFAEVCEHLADQHVSTVIGSAGWAQVEPEEGSYDFETVDAQIAGARRHGMRLVMIWFGAFKNAASTYAPRWVRADTERFPRAVLGGRPALWTYAGQTPKPVLSVFSPELLRVEQRAFVALMRHLALADPEHTVVLVQVENEAGVLGDSRDRSAAALAAWESPVPPALIDHLTRRGDRLRPELAGVWSRHGLRRSGTWEEVFGEGWEADELFMAWAFARHVEALAAAGKAVNALPMYVNAWLGPQPGQPRAGDYPSGGPTVRVLDVWKAAAPSVDLLAPDIYVSDVKSVLADYARDDNPLFVPEAQFRTGSLFYALGHHRAIGFSVFGVEDGRRDGQLARAYTLLTPMQDLICAAQAQGRVEGILLDEEQPEVAFSLGGFQVTARGSRDILRRMMLDAGVPSPPPAPALPSETEGPGVLPMPGDSRAFGLLIAAEEAEFLLVGQGLTLDFSHPEDRVEIDHVEEGRFEAGMWRPGRVLNGDERLYVVPLDDLGIVRVRLLRTPPLH